MTERSETRRSEAWDEAKRRQNLAQHVVVTEGLRGWVGGGVAPAVWIVTELGLGQDHYKHIL